MLGRLTSWVEHLPVWARPAAIGGLYIGAVVALRVLGAIIAALLRGQPVPVQAALLLPAAVAVGAYMGAVGGVVFALVRPRLRSWLGRAGDVVTGVLCVYAYMLSFAVPAAVFAHDEARGAVRNPAFWVISSAFGLLFGLGLAVVPRGKGGRPGT